MKSALLFLSAIILGSSGVQANAAHEDEATVSENRAYRYNDSFIFVENGITFSVYPDGEFDFYIEDYVTGSRNGVTFNTGYDYSPYAQYDDYGAVIQVENVPIFYDYYGRVSQIGDVNINYRNNRVRRIGGLHVYYNHRGFYDYHTGYINVFNRHYIYRPFHAFFARPAVGLCLVYNRPYRRYYSPIRYTYYRPYRYNTRKAYAKVGRTHRYTKIRTNRSQIYRNDERVAVRNSSARSNRSVARSTNTASRANKTVTQRSTSVGKPQRNTVSRRTVIETPRSKSVTRSTRTYKSPQRSTTHRRSVSQAPSRNRTNAVTRSTSTRSSASRTNSSSSARKAPARRNSSVSTRSTSPRSSMGRATSSRSSGNKTARSASSRSSRKY
ncbi:MAG TPA: hypothetical protein VFM69_15635 [Pricia sp.]|nr:hypothetical protein [Pricia sp.]